MAFYYKVLYTMANMGGLFMILWLIISLLVKPIMHRMQTFSLVNSFNNDREHLITSYKRIEQNRTEELANFKNSLTQRLNREAMLRIKEGEQEDEKVQEMNEVIQHDSGYQERSIELQVDSLKCQKSKSLKSIRTAKVYAVQEEYENSSFQEFQSKKNSVLPKEKNESEHYTTWDMLKAIFCCCRSKHSNSLDSKEFRLLENLHALNREREISIFLSKVTTLEKRSTILSEMLKDSITTK
mmetsp:Transcript_40378/g.39928  ORF Transcript_40378/g.39928 Transcript_40378/m.39928 type:complete len:240 (-) Transcript_40378:15-734(-)